MHLTFVINLYPPYVVGGNELQCQAAVLGLRRRGHRVSVICGRGAQLPADPDTYGVLEIDLDRKGETFLGGRLPTALEAFKLHLFSPRSYRETARALALLEPDVVVVWNLYMASLAPLLAAIHSRRPLAVHLFDKWLYHSAVDLRALLRPQVLWKRGAVAAAGLTLQPMLRRATLPRHMIAVSAFLKDFYVRAGFPAERIDVERLGVPTSEFARAPRSPRRGDEPLRLLFVGTLWEGKAPDAAVKGLASLVRSGVPARLDICGDGAAAFVSALRRLIDAEGLTGLVTLHGHVGREGVRRLCRECDVLVFPSQWDEPFAAVPLEGMSAGMAVVATTAGGTPEAIVDGETGLLIPPGAPEALGAALRRLAADDSLRLRLGEKAAQVARERYDWEGYVDRLADRYARLLESSGLEPSPARLTRPS